MTDPSDKFWISFLALGGVVEGFGIKHIFGLRPLSRTLAKLFRVHTWQGRLIFYSLWLLFSAWFTRHIVKFKVR